MVFCIDLSSQRPVCSKLINAYQSSIALLPGILMACLISLLMVVEAFGADNFRRLELAHRNAAVIRETLQPLLGDSVSISAAGNSLLIRAPQAEMNSVITLVRSLDRPQRRLHLSIFRGLDPSSVESIQQKSPTNLRWSTKTSSNNRLDQLNLIEGETLVITEESWFSLPVAYSYAKGLNLVALNGALNGAAGSHSRPALQPEPTEQLPANHSGSYEAYQQWIKTEEGIALTPVIVGEGSKRSRVSLKVEYSLPVVESYNSANGTPRITKASTISVVNLDQWQLLSAHSLQSNPVAVGKGSTRKHTVTTQKQDEVEHKVWVKVNLLNP